jgi:hypothetical protein
MTLYVVGLEVAVEARTQTCRRGQGAYRDGDDTSSHMTLKWLYKGVMRATQFSYALINKICKTVTVRLMGKECMY